MTQVKDMTDQQLNRKLTELMGYKVVKDETTSRYRMMNPQGKQFGMTWPTEGMVWNDYAYPFCTDPAASLEVQAKAIEVDPRNYAINLAKRLTWDGDPLGYNDNDVFSYTGVANFLLSSPRERAEAAYITLSSVKE